MDRAALSFAGLLWQLVEFANDELFPVEFISLSWILEHRTTFYQN